MKVLVSDSSILIEFSKRELLEKIFELKFQFAVPDLLFHEELVDLGRYSRQDFLSLGLRVESLDPEAVEMVIAYQPKRPALSLVDSLALALANRQGWHLLTEDRIMRNVAQSEGILHRDVLRAIESMFNAGILSTVQVVAALEAMRDDPRCPMPKSELTVRIRRLKV